jgi:hypothetical protein
LASFVPGHEPCGRCADQIERLLPKKRQAWNKTPLWRCGYILKTTAFGGATKQPN